MAVKVFLTPGLEKKVARSDEVTAARVERAERISRRAASLTPVGSGEHNRPGESKSMHRVDVDRSSDPPRVAATNDAWWFEFIEFGGKGFRPPPAPLRTAAKAEGTYRDTGR